jgi:hypothetical protein
MNIDPANFDFGPTHTDSGITILQNAENGEGCKIVEIAAIPAGQLEQVPTFKVGGVLFVFDSIDEFSGNLLFIQAGFVADPDDGVPSPVIASEFDNPEATTDEYTERRQVEADANFDSAVDLDGATD